MSEPATRPEEQSRPAEEPGEDQPGPDGPDEAVDAASSPEDGSTPEKKHWMDWWHHSHPTFAALTGFYAGLAYVILVPSIFAAVLGLVFGAETAERYFPYVLVFLLVPIGLLVYRRTRRFAEFVWVGILLTAVVVVGTAALTLWILVSRDG